MRLVQYPVGDVESAGDDDGDATSRATNGGGDERRVVATTVEFADSLIDQTRGLMFRRSLPDDYALAFRFDTVKTRDVHMLFVFVPIDAVWVVDGVVQRVERLRPWRGFAREECDLLVELPAGAGADVTAGDRLVFEE